MITISSANDTQANIFTNMTTNDWLITDTHFDHENIGVYCDRPEGWSDKILSNWRQLVKPEDLVIHLGDVMVGHGDLLALMNSLPGVKVLVMGNHDKHSPTWYRRNGFSIAVEAFAYKGATLTHRPTAFLFPGTDINIHGHCHNAPWNPAQSFQRLLAIEHEDYKPVSFTKWTAMARSPRKWAEYRNKMRTVIDIERRKREEPNEEITAMTALLLAAAIVRDPKSGMI